MLPLTPVTEKFILHWGEMGTKWGVNRTVAQIHALLYLAPRPLNAEEIAGTLSVARSNVSTSIRELQSWGVIRRVSVIGDRRDHFESVADVWEMFLIVMDERKRREIDPTIAVLRECQAMLAKGRKSDAHVRERVEGMLDFFETTGKWYAQMRRLPQGAIVKFFRMGSRVGKLLKVS
ncbi:MAG: GbsR/MarR family transcriptional regulator [Planctomycetota bacterium]|jgi:DNA-binding transcriptional regulator GbsR (MarR family)